MRRAVVLVCMDRVTVDQEDDPPTNQAEEFICGRATRDGSPCHALVSVPYLSCHQNNQYGPIVID